VADTTTTTQVPTTTTTEDPTTTTTVTDTTTTTQVPTTTTTQVPIATTTMAPGMGTTMESTTANAYNSGEHVVILNILPISFMIMICYLYNTCRIEEFLFISI
jgi:hypothetical protein